MSQRLAVTVRGTVQGVGFRPFVYRLAHRNHLAGWVRNSSGPVEIEVEGDAGSLRAFVAELAEHAPPLARVESVRAVAVPVRGELGFSIERSATRADDFQSVPADAGTCDDCVRELFDPRDRRHRYPFINCTNCGPRFTIIERLPYDRPSTTMRRFPMCEECRREYEDPADRRFHAQPNACPRCGPHLSMPLEDAVRALKEGAIVAVKGLGGYQLACDACDESAVRRLRRRKRRPTKPLAVMCSDPLAYCFVSAPEWDLLRGPARPIVLLAYRGGLAPSIAPHLNEVGVMLPYTPLHHLLVHDVGVPLVMTSGNLSEEPICHEDADAAARLGGIADVILAHDRPIASRYDDSVVRWAAGAARVVRRARGLAPLPVPVPAGPHVMATGAHLKAAFTVARDGRAYVGQHVGDLDDVLTLQSFQRGLATYLRLFSIVPVRVACDAHPDYASTRVAEAIGEPVRVQHHHAHVASVMAEHGLRGAVCGVAMDGTGLGPDGTVWGGEVLVGDASRVERIGHLAPVPLPGGDRCAREGWRMAAAYGIETPPPGVDPRTYARVLQLARSGRCVTTTSCGRLFDAVAAVLGVCHVSTYEGEAAVRLEAASLAVTGDTIECELEESDRLVRELAERHAGGEPAGRLAAVFHASLARAVVRACVRSGLTDVALSGGCFQNRRLLDACVDGLRAAGLTPYANERVPANDGGLSLGQAMVALCRR